MSNLARRLVAASEVREQARILLAQEAYDLLQRRCAVRLRRLAAALQTARVQAEKRSTS